jgi:hypothetical protein
MLSVPDYIASMVVITQFFYDLNVFVVRDFLSDVFWFILSGGNTSTISGADCEVSQSQ